MPQTWRDLHYLQRPAKNIERRMIGDLLLRLDRLRPLQDWRYVGLGSVYFADFSLFHRSVGFTDMVNIECEDTPGNKLRFEFNKPFGFIDLEWGYASTVLPKLSWDQPAVVWLDYDGKLDTDKLADLGSVVMRCEGPTLLLTSVNVESAGPNAEVLTEFEEKVTPERLPAGTVEGDVSGWGLAYLAHKVITAELHAAIADRNAGGAGQNMAWRQLLHFRYADGARMLTVGGLVYDVDETVLIDGAALDSFFFARTGDAAFRIRVPNITTREVLRLAAQMPCDPEQVEHEGIPLRERGDYVQAYRYFPSYVAVDL